MTDESQIIHPYIPNSVPAIKQEMLKAVAAEGVDEFYEDVPENLRIAGLMNLPEPLLSEYELKRHVEGLLRKNKVAGGYLNFLGAGCYQHHVPAVCDEINQRGEFLTAYAGEPYEDHGRFQALFEYASMMGELLNMEVVNVPTYDGYQASATALRMAARLTERREVILCKAISADKLSKIRDYLKPDIELRICGYDQQSGQVDLAGLARMVSDRTAAVTAALRKGILRLDE